MKIEEKQNDIVTSKYLFTYLLLYTDEKKVFFPFVPRNKFYTLFKSRCVAGIR